MVYLYSKLSYGCRWKTKQVINDITIHTVIFIGIFYLFVSFSFHLYNAVLMIHGFQTFQAWILQYFPRISSWESVPTYTKDMLYATAFSLLGGIQATEPFKVYLARLVFENMHFNNYVDHHETLSFDDIVKYFIW